MNELSRHIEILLLDNDCVIVPGFGGFMAHHSAAVYLDDAGMFYPPQRTLGFNPQLQLNDSLLAQSYVDAYDISYPEAVRKIESEVEEVRQTLTMEGHYEFHGIGSISLASDGKYDFQPCMAGLLTPSLYALDSFAIDPLLKANTKTVVIPVKHEEEDVFDDEVEESAVDYEEGIQIKFTTLRNILAVAMFLLLFVFSSIPAGLGSGNIQKCSIIDTELISSIISPSTKLQKPSNDATVSVQQPKVTTPAAPSVKEEVSEPSHYFTIVLASRVSKHGAEEFASQLKRDGMEEAMVFEHGSSRKVIYGKYNSEEEARKALSKLSKSHTELSQAWTTEISE